MKFRSAVAALFVAIGAAGVSAPTLAEQNYEQVSESSSAWNARWPTAKETWDNVAKFEVNPALRTLFSNSYGSACSSIATPYPFQWCMDGTQRSVKLYTNHLGGGVFAWQNAFHINDDGTVGTPTTTNIVILPVRLDIRNYGAAVDGVTDDTAAVEAAINDSNALTLAGKAPACIYFPAGVTLLNRSTPLPRFQKGGCVEGAELNHSIIKVGTTYSGDVFSWSESWYAAEWGANTVDLANNKLGATVRRIEIIGDWSTTHIVNAFMFYDRNDNVVMEDIQVGYINGRVIYSGMLSATIQAYMRESVFRNIRIGNSGTVSLPAVEFGSIGGAGGDATDEIDINVLSIFSSRGKGLVISNDSAGSVRLMRFDTLRLEANAGDNLTIQANGAGPIRDIYINHLDIPFVATGTAGIVINGNVANLDAEPYLIGIDGAIGGGPGDGVKILGGRAITLNLRSNAVSGTPLTIAGSPTVQGQILLNGLEQASIASTIDPVWKYGIKHPVYESGDPNLPSHVSYQMFTQMTHGPGSYELAVDNFWPSPVPIRANSVNTFSVTLNCFNRTTPTSTYSYRTTHVKATRQTTAASTAVTTPDPGTLSVTGNGSGLAGGVSADTTNGTMKVTVFSPTSDVWACSALVDGMTAQ